MENRPQQTTEPEGGKFMMNLSASSSVVCCDLQLQLARLPNILTVTGFDQYEYVHTVTIKIYALTI